jgi:hypothetical protein
MKIAVAALLVAASLAVPANAYADCGDPVQDPCTRTVPTVDQVVAIMAELTDPDRPAASKTDIVTPGFSPDEAGTTDDHLNRMRAKGLVPLNFVVTDIQPAPNNSAGATVATVGSPRQHGPASPIVLVDQGGHWLITHDSAVAELGVFWSVAHRDMYVPGFAK